MPGERAGQHLDEADAALLGVVQGLEDEGDGTVVIRGDLELGAVDERHLAVVGGRREVGGDVVHDGVDAQFARARADEHGHEQALGDGLREQALDLLLIQGLAVEVLHHELVVGLGDRLAQLLAGGLGGGAVLLGDVELGLRGALAVARLHADDVDDALERVARAPRQGDGAQAHAEALAQLLEAGVVIGVLLVDAVDEHRSGQTQVLGRIPQLDGGGLRALGGVDHEQRGLADAHRRVGVADEIGVARGVEHVDAGALPVDRGDGGRDRELALDLLGVVIERGLGARVAAQAGGLAGKVEHGLRERGLAHPALAYEHHVPHVVGFGSAHGDLPFRSAGGAA